ncbi:hypothetical protein MNBD_GAMMA12-1965 [hydrothermal vent metagenome]|uniref:Uncharacterized protein n=1 Tax=hydrothermal vent metagenome TaxID=652676 RepID=A0A3B0YLW9_9ZZZZ
MDNRYPSTGFRVVCGKRIFLITNALKILAIKKLESELTRLIAEKLNSEGASDKKSGEQT